MMQQLDIINDRKHKLSILKHPPNLVPYLLFQLIILPKQILISLQRRYYEGEFLKKLLLFRIKINAVKVRLIGQLRLNKLLGDEFLSL
jgi:hypothetical protein